MAVKVVSYRFVVRVWLVGRTQDVTVYIQACNRDNASLNVPAAVCEQLGFDVSSRSMLIVESTKCG